VVQDEKRPHALAVHAAQPLLDCEGEIMIALKNVLVAIDFDALTETVLAYARAVTRRNDARLHVLHVTENTFLRPRSADPHAVEGSITHHIEQRLTDEDRRDLHPVPVVRMSDAPAEEIVQYARDHDIDLIVMGTHGRKAVAHLFIGSVAERVVRDAPCPVLTVRERQHQRHPDTAHTEKTGV
jgi:nucleotide-binding universal stress UspA family protein